jgi:hypothetical protein
MIPKNVSRDVVAKVQHERENDDRKKDTGISIKGLHFVVLCVVQANALDRLRIGEIGALPCTINVATNCDIPILCGDDLAESFCRTAPVLSAFCRESVMG